PEDIADVQDEMAADPAIDRVVNEYWPVLTPAALLAEFYASPGQIDAAANELPVELRRSLDRPITGSWTPGDIPLLDEAAELLGVDEEAERSRQEQERHS